jgi:hypothetical protein
MDRPGYEADRQHINLYNRTEKTTAPLTAHVRLGLLSRIAAAAALDASPPNGSDLLYAR